MNILITGGTGSLGQALTEKLLKNNNYTRICIYSRDEHKQEQMKAKFNNDSKLRFFIGDVRDKDRLNLAMKDMHHVIHAAALKIVPTAEYNPFETLKTNILGTQNIVECAINNYNNGIYPRVVFVSTDKAVTPINLYGASKLCAEKLIIAANNICGQHGPRFSVVRYGNVCNSNGSVIPLFKSQISKGEQPTVTSDQMTRFWITLDEATNVILYALNQMWGGEVFVPKMPAFNVKDLAIAMMAGAGYPSEKQWTHIMGIRPGEKLHETIISKEEAVNTIIDINTGMYIIAPSPEESLTSADITSDTATRLIGQELHDKLVEIGAI